MSDVVERLLVAMNRHDLDAAVSLFHEDYRSEQPAHPDRTFVGRAQVRENWEAMFAGVPDFSADLLRTVSDGDTTWSEWVWSGTRADGLPFDVRGVALFRIVGESIVAARLYLEEVDRAAGGIAQAVESMSGHRTEPSGAEGGAGGPPPATRDTMTS
jgi:ketosteroid isomerase-like protein